MLKKVFRSIMRSWQRQTAMQLATLGVLIGSFIVLAFAQIFDQNLRRFLFGWGSDVKMSVYLIDQIVPEDQADIEAKLQSQNFIKNIKYLSKQEAYGIFKNRVTAFSPNILNGLEQNNPIPASFELVTQAGVRTQFQQVLNFINELKKMNGVEDVSYGQGWIENYASVVRVFSVASTLILIVLIGGILFVIGNSIHSAIEQRRDEIEILELFGATRSAIVTPYVIEGMFLGLFAAIVAVISVYVFYVWQIDYITQELGFLNLKSKIEFLSFERSLLLIISGAVLGGVGSFIWARKLSTGWAAATGRGA